MIDLLMIFGSIGALGLITAIIDRPSSGDRP